MPRRRSLSSAAIAAAALAVLDRDGSAGLSMRAVGAELGVGTMSLYRYVTDRDELERLIADLVLESVDTALPPRQPWPQQLAVLAERVYGAVVSHPAAIPLLLAHRQDAPASRRWTQACLTALTAGGFTGERRVVAQRCLLAYITGALQAQHYGALSGTGTRTLAALPEAALPEAALPEAALPESDLQLLVQTARDAQGVPPQQEFAHGLEIILLGLQATRVPT